MAGTPRAPTRPRQPPSAPPPQPRPPAATGASLAAATAAPGGTLAAGVVVGVLTAAEIRAIVSGAVNAMRKLSIVRYASAGAIVQQHLPLTARFQPAYRRQHPLEDLAAAERARELVFRRRQLVRVRRDLPRILALPDERRRLERLQGLVGREAHYTRQRVHAIAVRAVGVADSVNVEAASPAGAVWQLGHTLSHTPGCAYLHGHALAWPALRATGYIPPVHLRCDCRLRAIDSAAAEGLVAHGVTPTVERSLELIAHARQLEAG